MTAAIVRIKEDMNKLNHWLGYYSKYFDDLFVVCCQTPPAMTDWLHQKYNFTQIDINEHIHSMQAHEVVFQKQDELLKDHEWVLYADSDEYVIPFEEYVDLRDFMNKTEKKQTFCDGYEVVKTLDELPIDYGKPLLAQRTMWFRDESGSYNKPALSAVRTEWVEGFHRTRGMSDSDIKDMKDTGLYMVHLNHINDVMTDRKLVEIPNWLRRLI